MLAQAVIDWSRPWLAPYAALGRQAAQHVQAGAAVHEALNALAVADVPRFVPQSALPEGEAYEAFIFRTGQVPTRDNLHDFFNGLVWLHHPAAKRRLNTLQAGEIAAAGIGRQRGALRDALTVFDENAAVLQAPPALVEALRAREWGQLFGVLRPLWAQARLVLFGHALLEKLVAPRKAITGHVWVVAAGENLAGSLQPGRLVGRPFLPLPVLGVPGWWGENEDVSFYDDVGVFRPAAGVLESRYPVRAGLVEASVANLALRSG